MVIGHETVARMQPKVGRLWSVLDKVLEVARAGDHNCP